ncbi:MAG: hypothetical protein GY789_01745 [Hyphomicrobiales bacterium]|nr:hypothetical protein [Hyphomicrobiales bacterium]
MKHTIQYIFRQFMWLPIALIATAVHADMNPTNGPLPTIDTQPFKRSDAPAKRLVQLMYNPNSKSLQRHVYYLVAPQLEGTYDLTWEPAADHLPSKAISGKGKLIWRLPGTPAYSWSAVVAELSGAFSKGRAEGKGRFWMKNGTVYEGDWSSGQMHGKGRLQIPGGWHYEGDFHQGQRHGSGRLVDSAGTVFDGQFEHGHLVGIVEVTPFDEQAYTAEFHGGQEIAGTRRYVTDKGTPSSLHLAQVTQLTDARIGLSLDPTPPPDWFGRFSPSYTSRSDGSSILVYRADQNVRALWRNETAIPVRYGEDSDLHPASHFSPGFEMSFENLGNQPLQIVGGFVAVQNSASYLKPVMDVYVEQDCGQPLITQFSLHNYGWSQPEGANISVNILNRDGSTASAASLPVQSGWPVPQVNLAQDLMNQGVNLPLIENQSVLSCSHANAASCIEDLRRSGLYGNLSNAIDLLGSAVVLLISAQMDFSWRENNGSVISDYVTFNSYLKVGQLPFTTECGEGGAGEVLFPDPFRLSLDRSDYLIPFGLNATVRPGQYSQWAFQVEAEKASYHEFQIVLSLADGREIASRPVVLEYLRPADPYQNY